MASRSAPVALALLVLFCAAGAVQARQLTGGHASSLLDDITAVVTSGDVTNLNKIISAVEGGKAQQNNVVTVVTKTILGNKSALDVGGIVTLLVGLPVAVVVQILAGLTAPICIQILLGCCNQGINIIPYLHGLNVTLCLNILVGLLPLIIDDLDLCAQICLGVAPKACAGALALIDIELCISILTKCCAKNAKGCAAIVACIAPTLCAELFLKLELSVVVDLCVYLPDSVCGKILSLCAPQLICDILAALFVQVDIAILAAIVLKIKLAVCIEVFLLLDIKICAEICIQLGRACCPIIAGCGKTFCCNLFAAIQACANFNLNILCAIVAGLVDLDVQLCADIFVCLNLDLVVLICGGLDAKVCAAILDLLAADLACSICHLLSAKVLAALFLCLDIKLCVVILLSLDPSLAAAVLCLLPVNVCVKIFALIDIKANITLLQTILGLVARLNAKFCNSLLNALVAAKINVGRLGIKLAI